MSPGTKTAKEHPWEYLGASALAAAINYPLWRASAIGQSGFRVSTNHLSTLGGRVPPSIAPYVYAFQPPYKGMLATILGMTWARAAIFWGSDYGKSWLKSEHPNLPAGLGTILPPLVVSTLVQVVNMPLVRSTITLQNPSNDLSNIRCSMRRIYAENGWRGLYHGTSAGILKTVPKYCTAVWMKDYMDSVLPEVPPDSPTRDRDLLWRSACKSAAAGVAGAALTNPLDVIRNEMFKTNLGLLDAVRHLHSEMGWKFAVRGIGKNLVAVSIPVASTIFFTDVLIQMSSSTRRSP